MDDALDGRSTNTQYTVYTFGNIVTFTINVKANRNLDAWEVCTSIPFTFPTNSNSISANFSSGLAHGYAFVLANLLSDGNMQIGNPIDKDETLVFHGAIVFTSYLEKYFDSYL